MKKMTSLWMTLVALMFTLTSCNYKEYCENFTYEEHAVLRYDWSQMPADGHLPQNINLELTQSNESNIISTDNVGTDLNPGGGDYSALAWNPCKNIEMVNHKIVAKTNPDGSIMDVGELYTGKASFNLHSPEWLEQQAEDGNWHKWSSPPYHNEESYIFNQEVVVPMIPQTREIRVEIRVQEGDIDVIQSMTGALEGIYQSKNEDGSEPQTGKVVLTFEKDVDEDGNPIYVAVYRVLGTDEENPNLNLNIEFVDGSNITDMEKEVVDFLKDFNKDLGGEQVIIPIPIEITKEETGYTVKLLDWEDVNSGDNDLEAE